MNINLNCFKNLSIRNLFCCPKRENIIKPVKNFKVSKIDNIGELKEYFIDDLFIIMICVLNKKGKILSLTKNGKENITITNDISKQLGDKFYHLLQRLNKEVFNKKRIMGCKMDYENYEYDLIGIPVYSEEDILCSIIIKKISFDF